MQVDPSVSVVTNVAHVIQLAVAPVFLLSGVAGLLAVFVNRLGRIVDRSRRLEERFIEAPEVEPSDERIELALLSRRAKLINWATILCTVCALSICIVIAALFVGAFIGVDVSTLVGLMFIAAMLALTGGLMSFLGEVQLTAVGLRAGERKVLRQ